MNDPYAILGINNAATPEEVKKAYFELAKKYHPDSGDESEIKKFHEITEAYKILSEADSRKAYDASVKAKAGASRGEMSGQPTGAAGYSNSQRGSYRDAELKAFHQNRFRKAVFRLIAFTLLFALIGYGVSLVMGGEGIIGGASGLLIGFSLSVNRNFNMRSYFSDRAHKTFILFTWLFLLLGFSYFIWLIIRDIL